MAGAADSDAGEAGTRLVLARGSAAEERAGVFADDAAISTSARVTRPRGPEPRTSESSTPISRASLRVAGEARTDSEPSALVLRAGAGAATIAAGAATIATGAVTFGAGGAGAAAAAGAAAGVGFGASTFAAGAAAAGVAAAAGAAVAAPPAVSMETSIPPTLTICPAGAPSYRMRPAFGEGISTVALSVMTATSG